VRVRVQQELSAPTAFIEAGDHLVDTVPTIDDDRFSAAFVGQDRAVAIERTDGERFANHSTRIPKSR
jgi:hypothetical protein